MANIVLCRIDSRLIHGQVVTKWVGQSQANRIAVVSDELDADPFMKNIYLMAAPPNIKVEMCIRDRVAVIQLANTCGAAVGGYALDTLGLLSPLMLSGSLMLLTALLVAAKVRIKGMQ